MMRLQRQPLQSCEACRRRKLRCDRTFPCARCVQGGLQCVPIVQSGLPRGRQGGRHKKNVDLLGRISKLETLVKGIESGFKGGQISIGDLDKDRGVNEEPMSTNGNGPRDAFSKKDLPLESNKFDRYLGSSVWATLYGELNGVRNALDQRSDEELDAPYESMPLDDVPQLSHQGQSHMVLGLHSDLQRSPSILIPANPEEMHYLRAAFMNNVEPIVKVLHVPSLNAYFDGESEQLACSPGPQGLEALKYAMNYISVASLNHEQCVQVLGSEKHELLSKYRSLTENALVLADFVTSEELSTLQALLFYLLALRCNDSSRRTWSLLGLLVRNAHALGLHRDTNVEAASFSSSYSLFIIEMRRRLWWQICLLDRQASADRGTDLMIAPGTFNTPFPLNIDDENLGPGTIVAEAEGKFTDVTLSLVCHEAFEVGRRLNHSLLEVAHVAHHSRESGWEQKRGWLVSCQQNIEQQYLRHCDVLVPIQRYTKFVAEIIIARMWLNLYRPLQRLPDVPKSFNVPRHAILQLSTNVVEASLRIPAEGGLNPFHWMSSLYVPWDALAIMIAELCVQSEGDIVEKAWTLVPAAYTKIMNHIADSRNGRLSRPLRKLMKKAQQIRINQLGEVETSRRPYISQSALSNPLREIKPVHDLSVGLDAIRKEMEDIYFDPFFDRVLDKAPQNDATIHGEDSKMFEWGSWLTADDADQNESNSAMGQVAWTNWESFINDIEADIDFSSELGLYEL